MTTLIRKRRTPTRSAATTQVCRNRIVLYCLAFVSVVYVWWILKANPYQQQSDNTLVLSSSSAIREREIPAVSTILPTRQQQQQRRQQQQCPFRDYSKRRYYYASITRPDGSLSLPDFLATADYIYGRHPIVLQPSSSATKLCVDQSEWDPSANTTTSTTPWPFADGTNPSLLKLDRFASSLQDGSSDGTSPFPFKTDLDKKDATPIYLATLCMTNSQCAWKDSPQEQVQYRISKQTKPSTVRTLLLLLNRHLETLSQTTISLELDAPWGKKTNPKQDNQGSWEQIIPALDDARLFLHNTNELWVSYREGPGFGYDKQVLNRVHITLDNDSDETMTTFNSGTTFRATIKASETTTFCCGRNMALMQHPDTKALQSLTWADPVTVVNVMDSSSSSVSPPHGRRLAAASGKSHFHGTNAFMIPLPNGEFLGIGHFHRPPGRDKNEYARFGHHYTHAFFTIAPTTNNNNDNNQNDNSSSNSYHLTRLSQEFVFPSQAYPKDAEIIQFASGMELHEEHLVIAYGINDCEGAAIYVDLQTVEDMLIPVGGGGRQVVDLMWKVMMTRHRRTV